MSRAEPPVVASPPPATSRAVTALACFRRRLRSALRQSWPLLVSGWPGRGAPFPPRPGQPSARATPAGRLSPAGDGARAAPAPATPEAGSLVRGWPCWHRKNHPRFAVNGKNWLFFVSTAGNWFGNTAAAQPCCLVGAQGFRCAPALRPPTQPSPLRARAAPLFNWRAGGAGFPGAGAVPPAGGIWRGAWSGWSWRGPYSLNRQTGPSCHLMLT